MTGQGRDWFAINGQIEAAQNAHMDAVRSAVHRRHLAINPKTENVSDNVLIINILIE